MIENKCFSLVNYPILFTFHRHFFEVVSKFPGVRPKVVHNPWTISQNTKYIGTG